MTLIFWLLAWAITLLVLGPLLWPLLKRQEPLNQEEREQTLSVYRQQFAELEQDLRNDLLTEEQYQQSKRELERRLLEETGPAEAVPPVRLQPMNTRVVVVALAVIIPAISGLLYWTLGNPEAIILSQCVFTGSTSRVGLRPSNIRRARRAFRAAEKEARAESQRRSGMGPSRALVCRNRTACRRDADL